MAGVDAIRGVAFQNACAVKAAIDVLSDAQSAVLRIEGHDDIVDYEVRGDDGTLLLTAQVKSRMDSQGPWTPGEIALVLRRWDSLADAQAGTRFVFLSDADLGPTARRIRDALGALAAGRPLTGVDRKCLVDHDLDELSPVVTQGAEFQMRAGSTHQILSDATVALARLSFPQGNPSPSEVSARIDRLFAELVIAGGDTRPFERSRTRAELADLVGLSLEEIDAEDGWHPDLPAQYRVRLPALLEDEVTARPLTGVDIEASAILDVSADREISQVARAPKGRIADLVDLAEHAALVAPFGMGKSTALRAVLARSCTGETLPVLLTPRHYEAGRLENRVHDAINRVLGKKISAPAMATLLSSQPVLLAIDGVGDLPRTECNDMIADARKLTERFPAVRLLFTGRGDAPFVRQDVPIYRLEGLNHSLQARLTQLVSDSSAAIASFEARRLLGEAAEVPLFFLMALAAKLRGETAASRTALYRQSIRAMRLPSGGEINTELVVAAVSVGSIELLRNRRTAASRSGWLDWLQTALDLFVGDNRFSVEDVPAERLLDDAIAAGLLRYDAEALVGYAHDSLREYLVAEALCLGLVNVPADVPREWEEVLERFAEVKRVPNATIRGAAAVNLVALGAIARAEPSQPQDGVSAETVRLVLSHLAAYADAGVSCLREEHGFTVAIRPGGPTADFAEPRAFWRSSAESDLVVGWAGAEAQGALGGLLRLWLALLDESMPPSPRAGPRVAPSIREDLPAAVSRAFAERRSAVETIAAQCLPSLHERVVAFVGCTGFEGIVLPPVGRLPFGREHPLVYRTGGTRIRVELRNDATASEGWKEWGRGTAEDFVQRDPYKAAREEIARAVRELLLGWFS